MGGGTGSARGVALLGTLEGCEGGSLTAGAGRAGDVSSKPRQLRRAPCDVRFDASAVLLCGPHPRAGGGVYYLCVVGSGMLSMCGLGV